MDGNAWKVKGNEAFSAKDFPAAIEDFTKGIEVDATNHVLWSNRSASYASLGKFQEALEDGKKCVEVNPAWPKGYLRLGAAHHGLKQYEDAVSAYEAGLKVDAGNASLTEALATVRSDMAAAYAVNPFAKVFNKDCIAKIQANHKIAPYMMDPTFIATLSKIIDNPSQAQLFLKDQRIMHVFMELSGISMPTGDDDDDEPRPAAKKAPEAPKKKAAEPAKPVGNPEALKLKDEGNAFYKEHKFDEALEKYNSAIEVDPTNTVYFLNKTAVYFEQKDYEACIVNCEAALEHGRENKAEFTVVGRLMTRQALCSQRLGRYEEAIALYKRALVEYRNPDTLQKLKDCEKEFKEAEIKAYLSPELGAKAKEEGNAFFKSDKFPQAVESYSEAIKRNPQEHTAYSNRAAAYIKLGAYTEALSDCEKCLTIKPEFVKAHARKGHCYFWTKQYNKALQAYEEGIIIDGTNAECRDGKMKTMMKIQEMATGEGDEDAAKRAMSDPEIQAIMNDSYMQMVLGEMQKNPARINDYMKDPGVAGKINKLITAGILRVGNPSGGGGGQQRR